MTGEAPNTQKALRGIEKLRAENERLREALRPFANVPTHGAHGGPLVSAQAIYEDGSSGEDLPLSPTWPKCMPHEWFARARAALGEDK
jgi:hypothetical protein